MMANTSKIYKFKNPQVSEVTIVSTLQITMRVVAIFIGALKLTSCLYINTHFTTIPPTIKKIFLI